MTERFVVATLAHPRSAWATDLVQGATTGALPVEIVQCVSMEELRARLASGRAFSAVVLDSGVPGVDRELLDPVRRAGAALIVVASGRAERDWLDLGAMAVVARHPSRDELLHALRAHAVPIVRGDEPDPMPATPRPSTAPWRGTLVAVTGAAGAGTSTAAMALAQGLAQDPRHDALVVLADLALDADQALLHDAGDVVPGVQELTEAYRGGHPSAQDVRGLTFLVAQRRYHLLLGLRRHRDWAAIRPRSFEAALDGLRRSFRIVVADVDPDLEGEATCGSIDVEERNTMARTTLGQADVVLVVGRYGIAGLAGQVRVLAALVDHGVDARRLAPVISHAPRSPRARAELTRALAELSGALVPRTALASPIYLPERRRLDDAVRDATRLPQALVSPLVGAVGAALDRCAEHVPAPSVTEPVAVAPGSLGWWADQEAAPG